MGSGRWKYWDMQGREGPFLQQGEGHGRAVRVLVMVPPGRGGVKRACRRVGDRMPLHWQSHAAAMANAAACVDRPAQAGLKGGVLPHGVRCCEGDRARGTAGLRAVLARAGQKPSNLSITWP